MGSPSSVLSSQDIANQGLLQYFPGTNTPVIYPDLNKLYGNPDVPGSPLYGAYGTSGTTTFSLGSTTPVTSPSSSSVTSTDLSNLPLNFPTIPGAQLPTQSPYPNNIISGAISTLNNVFGGPTPGQPTSGIGAGLFGPGSTSGNIAGSISSGISGALSGQFGGFTWGRIGAFLLALILIAAGLWLFGRGSVSDEVRGFVRKGVTV